MAGRRGPKPGVEKPGTGGVDVLWESFGSKPTIKLDAGVIYWPVTSLSDW